MSATSKAIGRAAFRAVHAKTGGKHPPKKVSSDAQPRGSNEAIVKEALRSLDPEQSKIEAARNANIVLADEALNENWVNDGQGSMKTATAFKEAIDYLALRNAQLFRKQTANDYELSELVVHLPANMCVEDTQNVSYVLDESGSQILSAKTGEPLTKPRLVPRDHVDARRYFDDAQSFLIEHGVIAGGIDGVHWRSDQYSEHRPHMQIGFDNYATDPKRPGRLRNEFSRKWFSHRDVRYPAGHPKVGKSISGKVKLSEYQSAMREFMIARGWPVEAGIDCTQEGTHRGKAAHTANDNARIIAEDRLATAIEKEEAAAALAAELDEFSEELAEEAAELRLKRSTAARDGYADGKQQGYAQGVREAAGAVRTRESAVAQREQQLGRERLALMVQLRKLREDQDALKVDKERLTRRLEQAKIIASGNEAEYRDVLAKIKDEHRRWLMRPALFESWLDAPLKDGKTLRPAYERFAEGASTSPPSAVPRPKRHPLPEVSTAVPGDTDAPEV